MYSVMVVWVDKRRDGDGDEAVVRFKRIALINGFCFAHFRSSSAMVEKFLEAFFFSSV